MLKRFVTGPHTAGRAATLTVSGLLLILGSVLLMNLQVTPSSARNTSTRASSPPSTESRMRQGTPQASPGPAGPASAGSEPVSSRIQSGGGLVTVTDLSYLSNERLLIPVAGVNASQLRDSFTEGRSDGRRHEAIDIPAPQGTPVLAAADGQTARLFNSVLGGITLYCFDKSGQFVFYYGHLSGYADGVAEGKAVKKGEVLGYVGNTGNAGPGNFHLHFAISKVTTPWKWHGGEAIDPYPLLGGKPLGEVR